VLYLLGRHFDEWGLDRFQIFLDSPMAIEASKVYWGNRQHFDEEAKRLSPEDNGPQPGGPQPGGPQPGGAQPGMPLLPNLKLTRSPEDSMAINRIRSGAIIIAGSGMCNGGRIVHHLKHNLPYGHNHVIIVGYQAFGTLGRKLVDRFESVRIHGEEIAVKAKIHTVGGLSAHGDQDDLARWYECIGNRPPVYLVHGERESQTAFKEYLLARNGAEVHLPDPGDILSL
jgi:metallo-beta-lactamase family protein